MSENSEEVVESSTVEPSTGIALPPTIQGLMDMRKSKNKRTLNDQVELIHIDLWANEDYRRYLEAVYAEQSIEGSLLLDDAEAARMIRDVAIKSGNSYVAKQKLSVLIRTLNVVMRRFQATRKERRL